MVDRALLLADNSLTGAAWCRAHGDLVDVWLQELLARVADGAELALVALGGYGRSELCPQSDIDVMLVHNGRRDIREIADRIWYPIWDEGLHLGHSVCTVREAVEVASDNLDTATALLSARHVAGDPDLSERLAASGRAFWEKHSKRLLTELGTRVELRHETAGEVAFRLEPDLKEGRGGLRDVHAMHWVQAAKRVMFEHDEGALSAAYAVILDVRVELQRITGRPSNVLSLQDQEAVASALGDASDDALVGRVAEAARTIAWTSDDTWRRIRSALRGPLGRAGRRTRALGGGLELRDGEVHLGLDADAGDPILPLRAAHAAAVEHGVIDRHSLETLARHDGAMPEPWPHDARRLFVEMLLVGPWAVRVVEALDQRGIWARLVPEWMPVRALPQRNPYHRFTVDRHLLEAVANAARLAARVGRPDLLVMAALLHDMGKGYEGDHSHVGVGLAKSIAGRMGFPPEDIDVLAWLVEHHLLLADVAVRRDLDDPTTVERVAKVVHTPDRLELLAALTEADSLATGPAAWGPSKARLVAQLVERVAHVLEGRAPDAAGSARFPSAAQLDQLSAPGRHVDARDDVLSVVTDDRPGVFSRIAGVLALHGLDVLSASAHSSEEGRALSEFQVADPVRHEVRWPRVVADLNLGLDGRLAIAARLAERARTYSRSRSPRVPASAGITVTFDDDASGDATVIDVQAPDGIGVLYRITRVFAEFDLDIRSARVQTLGHHVVDAFYLRDGSGQKISDPHLRAEIERALIHSLTE